MRLRISMLVAAMAALFAGPAAADGSAAAGAVSFHNHCDGCHTINPAEGDGEGPNLGTVMGRKAGSLPDFEYSRVMRDSGIVWAPDTITQFVNDPNAMVPGNKMTAVHFKGIPPAEIPDLIAYLQSKQVVPAAAVPSAAPAPTDSSATPPATPPVAPPAAPSANQ